MKYLKLRSVNINLRLLVIYFIALFLSSCNGGYDKQFYGTYSYVDSNKFAFSKITFYENHQYAFYRSNCFSKLVDSGKFSLINGTISFHSFDLSLPDTNDRSKKKLNEMNFLYQPGKIFYVQKISPFNKPSYFDTIIIGEKKI